MMGGLDEQIAVIDRMISLLLKNTDQVSALLERPWAAGTDDRLAELYFEVDRLRAVRAALAGLMQDEPFGPMLKRNPVVAESVPQEPGK